jgi:tRNA threonylcarbamoyladenosine biosynthesis protein TsaB
MRVLAIDTSGDACSAALLLGERVSERFEIAPRRHAELLLPMIDALLGEAGLSVRDLDGIAYGRGPGAFTGLRIAAGVTQGIALAAALPVAPVSSLAALARGVWREHTHRAVLAAFDARLGEIYFGAFRVAGDAVEALGEERVAAAQAVPIPGDDQWIGAGSGWRVYRAELEARFAGRLQAVLPDAQPHAHDVAVLGRALLAAGAGLGAAQALPVYLREEIVRGS